MVLQILHLGRVAYTEGLRAMQLIADARHQGRTADTLLLMEHPPVLTLGRNGSRANIRATEAVLEHKGVAIHEVNRGGDITYHGPGQLVGYPIFDLRGDDLPEKRGPHLGPVDFVRLLEQAIILTCNDFGVPAQRIPKRTGVWTLAGGRVAEKKVAAIGIHVARAITTHGFALNVTTDLRDFQLIVPCGIADRDVTSLEQEAARDTQPTLNRAGDAVARNMGRVFRRQILAVNNIQQILQPGCDPRPAEVASQLQQHPEND